jgi:hypothetical protein
MWDLLKIVGKAICYSAIGAATLWLIYTIIAVLIS